MFYGLQVLRGTWPLGQLIVTDTLAETPGGQWSYLVKFLWMNLTLLKELQHSRQLFFFQQ